MGSNEDEDTTGVDLLNIPVLDLRSFCQDELLVAAELSGNFPEAWCPKLIIPTLDKNIFNASLASWKQTYRGRLQTRHRGQSNSSVYAHENAALGQISNSRQSKRLASKSKHGSLNKKAKYAVKADVKAKIYRIVSKRSKSLFNTSIRKRSTTYGVGFGLKKGGLKVAYSDRNSNKANYRNPRNGDKGFLQEAAKLTPRDAGSSAVDHALQLPMKKMRLKDSARNRLLRQMPENQHVDQTTAKELPDTPQVPNLNQDKASALPDLNMPSNPTKITSTLGSLEKDIREMTNLGLLGDIGILDDTEDTWWSRYMHNALVGGRFCNVWEPRLHYGFQNVEGTGLP